MRFPGAEDSLSGVVGEGEPQPYSPRLATCCARFLRVFGLLCALSGAWERSQGLSHAPAGIVARLQHREPEDQEQLHGDEGHERGCDQEGEFHRGSVSHTPGAWVWISSRSST